MIKLKNRMAVQKMQRAGCLLATVFEKIERAVVPGVSTLELDAIVENLLIDSDMIACSKGYKGYRHVSCISLNDEVVHGVPSANRVVCVGDLVKIDICAAHRGYCADATRSYCVGLVDNKVQDFVRVAKLALEVGIAQAVVGNRLGDVSAAIQEVVERAGYNVVRDFAGHGIGRRMHEEPEILNYGTPGIGSELVSGMTLALEPMITMGDYRVYVDADGWTVKTRDGSLAAHVEDTIVITQEGPVIFTRSGIQGRGL